MSSQQQAASKDGAPSGMVGMTVKVLYGRTEGTARVAYMTPFWFLQMVGRAQFLIAVLDWIVDAEETYARLREGSKDGGNDALRGGVVVEMMGLVACGDVITAKPTVKGGKSSKRAKTSGSVQFTVEEICDNGTLDVRRIREEGAGVDKEPTENVRIEDATFELERLEEILRRGSPFLCLKWESPKAWTKWLVRGGRRLACYLDGGSYCLAIAVCLRSPTPTNPQLLPPSQLVPHQAGAGVAVLSQLQLGEHVHVGGGRPD